MSSQENPVLMGLKDQALQIPNNTEKKRVDTLGILLESGGNWLLFTETYWT